MHPLYRITAIRPKTLGMYGALAAAIFAGVQLLFDLVYVLFLGGFSLAGNEFSPDVLYLLIPAAIAALMATGIGFFVGWVAAVAYNHLHPFIGTLSVRLSKSYVRN